MMYKIVCINGGESEWTDSYSCFVLSKMILQAFDYKIAYTITAKLK